MFGPPGVRRLSPVLRQRLGRRMVDSRREMGAIKAKLGAFLFRRRGAVRHIKVSGKCDSGESR